MPGDSRLTAVATVGATLVLLWSPFGETAAQTQPAAPSSATASPPAASTPTTSSSTPAPAVEPDSRPSFQDWLAVVRTEALARGVREEVIEQALGSIQAPLPVVIERDRTQAETILPLETYIARRLTAPVIRSARQMATRHQEILDEVAGKYGVPMRVILAVWGLESNFGRFTGVRPTVAALATLAWDGRRAALFRAELFNALEILNRGDIEPAKLKGSWAGAMGQPQFMPSSYLQYAEDFDGDGRRDIWSTHADVFASVANYLRGYGWVAGERWGREVQVSADTARKIASSVDRRTGTCQAKRDMTVALPLDEWQALGVRTLEGANLPSTDQKAALVAGATRHFLVYQNYDVLLGYNCAHAYAISVALLSDRIAQAPAKAARR